MLTASRRSSLNVTKHQTVRNSLPRPAIWPLLLLAITASSKAAENQSKNVQSDPVAITVIARQSANRDIMNAVSFDVTISNLTQTDIAITGIRLDIQEPVPSTRDDQKWVVLSNEMPVPPGVTIPQTLIMP